jgi:hypothetical protein
MTLGPIEGAKGRSVGWGQSQPCEAGQGEAQQDHRLLASVYSPNSRHPIPCSNVGGFLTSVFQNAVVVAS